MIYLTGDTHLNLNTYKLHEFNKINKSKKLKLTKDDYVIICGDFGLLWSNEPSSKEVFMKDFYQKMPWTTLFIDGNHENFKRLNKIEEVEMFGSKVGKVYNDIYHLRRGHIYNIDNYSFFCFGGGGSIDKVYRTEFISWWKEELPSKEEEDLGLKNLADHNWEVDYILSHTCSNKTFYNLMDHINLSHKDVDGYEKNIRAYFDFIENDVKFNKWYFGHFHDDIDLGKHRLLYEDVIKLGE